ncbi:MAG: divalent-cation tolerance protein CutA [Hyperthermus sp.]|nr:MAG: divalent-cation tolerance protein CutA [Hyperthermus sp.]
MESGVIVVFITAPRAKGEDIAMKILEKRLAACVNIVPVKSMYWWRGRIERDDEDLLIVKTTVTAMGKLIEEVKKIHPYTVPEILGLPVVACNREYCEWARGEVGQAPHGEGKG